MEKNNNLQNGLSINTKQKVATLHTEIEYNIHLENNLNMEMHNLKIPIKTPDYTRYKDGSLYINEEKYKLNDNHTFTIPIFSVNNILDIIYKVVVIDIPQQGSIDNCISLSYLENVYESDIKEIRSNKIKTMVKGAKLEIENSLSNYKPCINDEIFEDIIIVNKGNIKALNLIIEEIIPQNIIIESMIVNDSELIEIENYKSIPIGNLEPLKSVKIRWYGRVIGVNNNVANIVTKVVYSYFNDYTEKYIEGNIVENSSLIYVKQGYVGSVNREKHTLTLDKKISLINEEIMIKFLSYNIGNIKVENVKLNLDIDKGVEIVKLLLNDVDINLEEIKYSSEISIRDIAPGGEIKLQGIVKVNNLEDVEKKIKIKVEYKYFDEVKNEYRKDRYISNEVKLKGYGVSLENPQGCVLYKECSTKFCKIGDIVEYRICIKNNGNIRCNKLIFKEDNNKNSEFIKGTFKVGNKEFEECDIYKGVYIGSLDVGEILNIDYKSEVINEEGDWLISTSYLEYTENLEAGVDVNRKIELINNKTRIIYPMLLETICKNEIEVYRKEDNIIYNIELGNIGNVDLDNINFNFSKSEELELKKINVNNEEIEVKSIENINIKKIKEEQKINILMIFKVKDNITNKKLHVGGKVTYRYTSIDSDFNEYKVLILNYQRYHIIYGDLRGDIRVKDKNTIKGDEIEGELAIENVGNIDLYNIELIPDESNTIDLIDKRIINNYKLPKYIKSNEKIIIPIKLKGNEIYNGKIFNYSTNLKAKYKFNEEEVILEKSIDNIEIELVDEVINCEINSNKNSYILDEKAYFSMSIRNLGSHSLEEAILRINIPNELEIIDDHIYVRDKVYSYIDVTNGVNLEKIDINERIIIKYSANIKKISFNSKLHTYYKIDGYYNLETSKERIYKEYSSEVLKNRVDKISAKVFLNSDKELLLNGQDVKYTSTIINDGTIPIDINYKLYIGDELEEITELTTLNGDNINDLEGSIRIEVNDGIIIEKTYIYKRFKGIDNILVQGIVEASYKTIDEKYSGYKEIKTEVLKMEITNTTFKELIIEEIIDISEIKPIVGKIINIYVNPTITNQNIRKIKRDYEYDSVDIIGYRLEIIGNVQYTIEYVSDEDGVYLIAKEIIFTSTIMLPQDFIPGETIIITPKLLDINHKIIKEDRIFINMNLLINTSV